MKPPAPSGNEGEIRAVIRAEVEKFADEIRVDALGNLLVRKGKKSGNGMRVMLSAHMDEIGAIATYIDEKGFVRFTSIGGVYPVFCIGGRVRFSNGTAGLIGVEKEFMKEKNRLVSKAMDDRIGVAVLIETIRTFESSPHELYFVFTTQEEVGLRGATTSAFGIDPDVGIAVDVTLTGDTPKGSKMEVSLGKGPAIKVRDGGMLADPRLVRKMVETAEKEKIPYQLEVLEGGTTDARAIQMNLPGLLAAFRSPAATCILLPKW